MKSTILEGDQNVKVRFHVGRGGHFHNAGHKTYVGTVDNLADCFGDAFIISEDENGKVLPDSEWQLVDDGGNVILQGREQIESPTGVLDWDGQYDTDVVKYLSECSDDEYQIIIDAFNDGEYVEEEVIDYACSAMDMLRMKPIGMLDAGCTFDGDKMTIHTQDGDRTVDRNEFANEDEARELVSDMGFINESVDKIAFKMEYEGGWFDEDED